MRVYSRQLLILIALDWLLAQNPWIVPIPGATKLWRLEEKIGAVSIELSGDELRNIDDAASSIPVQGERYPEQLEKMTARWFASLMALSERAHASSH